MVDSILHEVRKIPPVTRFLCASLLGVSLSAILGFVHPYNLVFIRELVTKKWEFWRLYTTFFFSGGGLPFIFDFVMLYRNSNELESSYFGRSADYAWQLIMAAGALILPNLPLRTAVHTRPFLVTMTYLSSRLAPAGAQTSLMGLFSFPVIYFPYVLVALDLLMAGPAAAASSLTGILVGHLWWWGVWDTRALDGVGRAPAWLGGLVGNTPAPTTIGPGVHVIPPAPRGQAGQRNTGYNWGSGHRLGSS